ncbi:phage portal protein [Streptomyces ortus]|uniref:Phage portal protein n=1 Tax=Streptomyces ortus TaxID=2867268 RepID=A0ABT3V356_9ACTN|nr:phage portal protein [Streptomyces ortus]MCX4232816.1 phage portal protein [Streptomyces ortus]
MLDDLVSGWQALEEALPEYEKAEAYYKGTVDEVFASPRIRQAIAATGDRYRFNLAKTPVNVLANRVELTAVTVPEDEANSQVISVVWDANNMDVHYPDLILRAFEYGDSYLMAWPIYEDDPDTVEDDELYASGVELTVHSPLHCRVIYDPENERRKLFAIKRWKLRVRGEKAWRVDLYYPDHIEQWISKAGGEVGTAEGWEPFLDDDDPESWLLDNPYNEIPFFHHRNALPYGVPEHKDGYGCQDAINKMLITQLTTTDSHGWPQRYALTEQGAELDQNNDGPLWSDDADADDTSGTTGRIKAPSSGLSGGPGTMLELEGMKSVGQFAAAQPEVFTDPAQLYIRLMAQVTETPLHAFDPSGDTPSGESLKVAEAPLVKKAINREAMLKGAIQETWKFVLRILGVTVPRIDVRFAPAQAATGKSDWEVVELKQAVGVPKDQTLIEAGYEADVVADWDLSTPTPPVAVVPAAAVPVENPQMEAPNA